VGGENSVNDLYILFNRLVYTNGPPPKNISLQKQHIAG